MAQLHAPLVFEKINGLSQNTVFSITQDRQGFVWIGTADGLNRFDGIDMKVFKPNLHFQSNGVVSSTIRSKVLEDASENLWFSSESGVYSYSRRNGKFEQLDLPVAGIPHHLFAEPIMTVGDSIWFCNGSTGLYCYSTANKHIQVYTPPPIGNHPLMLKTNGMYDGKQGLWFVGQDGVYQFNMKKKSWSREIAGGDIVELGVSRDTIYWMEKMHLKYYSKETKQVGIVPLSPESSKDKMADVRCIYTDKDQNIWVGDMKGNIWTKQINSDALVWMGNINDPSKATPAYPVYSICIDRNGLMFVGGDVVGLYKTDLNKPPFKSFPPRVMSGTAKSIFISSIAGDENGNIYAGTFGDGVYVKNSTTTKDDWFTPLAPLTTHAGFANHGFAHNDQAGNTWLSYGNALFLHRTNTKGYQKIELPVPANNLQKKMQVNCLWQTSGGWYVGTNLGLYKVKDSMKKPAVIYYSIFGLSHINCIWQESETRLWVGGEGAGINIVDPTKGMRNGQIILDGAGIKSLMPDSARQIIWIATKSGFVAWHLPSGKYRVYAENDGLLNSYCYGCLQYKNDMWLSTNQGLSRISLTDVAGSVFPEVQVVNFTSADGLPNDEFNTSAFYMSSDSAFYFGTIKGIAWFKPSMIHEENQAPSIAITNIMVNGKVADSSTTPEFIRQLRLPYNSNDLLFEFRAIEFANPDIIEYAVQLQGYEKTIVFNRKLNQARYSQLPTGHYRFTVMARKSGGPWSRPQTVEIFIEAPFWKTWWFYTLLGLSLFGGVVLVTKLLAQRKLRARVAELEKQKAIDKERQRISREMHDDIGAGLTQITLMSEAVKRNYNKQQELDEIASISRQLVSNMGEIIWSLNPENKTLEQLYAYLRDQLGKLLEYSGIDYKISFPENGHNILLSNEQRRNMLLVTKEIVHNAIKHAHAKKISIESKLHESTISFRISDDGIGFDPDMAKGGNGLRNIQTRIAELGGTIEIQTAPTSGCSFKYNIPL